MIKAVAALCLVAVAVGAGFLLGERFGGRDTQQVGQWARCDAGEVANAGLARALAAVAGRTLVIPSGCRLLIGPPAPTTPPTPAVSIPSGTRIRCEGPTAEIVLARRACAGDTTTPGATCHAASDCAGTAPTCATDGGGAVFGDGDAVPTIFAAAPGARDVAIEGCTIRVGQRDVYDRCSGGKSPGRACGKNAPCDEGQCQPVADKTAGGGRVNVIDLSQSSPSRIHRVAVLDHRRGDFTFRAGAFATVTESDNTRLTTGGRDTDTDRPYVRVAIGTNGLSTVAHNHVHATEHGIEVTGILPSHVSGNWVAVAAEPNAASPSAAIFAGTGMGVTEGNSIHCQADTREEHAASSATGIMVGTPVQQVVHHNAIIGCYHGIEVDQRSGNVTIDHNRVLFGAGAKLVMSQYGNTVTGNYLAWGTGNRTSIPPGMTCRGMGRRTCRTNADCGDAGACRPEPIIWVGEDGEIGPPGSQHNLIEAGNLLSSEHPDVPGIRLADTGARCADGRNAGRRCAADVDCPDAHCFPGEHRNLTIRGNAFLNAAGDAIGVDLGELVSGETKVDGLLISGNLFSGGERPLPVGVRMPPRDDVARGVTITGNYGNVTRITDRWDWESGIRTANEPAASGDEAVGLLTLHNGTTETLSKGDAVEISAAAEHAVRRATAGAGVVGVLLRGCEKGQACLLATGGTIPCRLAPGVTVAPGTTLTVDPRGFVAAGKGAAVVAVALAAGKTDGDSLVACLLQRH